MPIDPKIFKTYDIRGKYPSEINEAAISEIAAAIEKKFRFRGKLVIGYDARLSSPALYRAVLKGLGFHPYILYPAGLITTPMLYFLVNKLKADGGIMVTASHNPKEYNGLKIVGKNGRPVSGKEIQSLLKQQQPYARAISSFGLNPSPRYKSLTATARLTPPFGLSPRFLRDSGFAPEGHSRAALFNKDCILFYVNFIKNFLKPLRQTQGKPLKVVFDCSNGATGLVLKKLFGGPGRAGNKSVKAVFINDKLDGNFPAHGPNPLARGADKELKTAVKKQKADLGVIFDADGDRVFLVDNLGRPVATHEAGFLLTQLFQPLLVASVISSWRIKKLTGENGERKIYISRVGHYFFKRLMREKKAFLGVEPSGHFYFKKFFYCDSGILAAVEVINFVSGLKTDFASWLNGLSRYYRSGELNFKFRNKEKVLDKIEKVYRKGASKISKIDGLLMEFDNWWFNVRSSNTEPLLRLNVEATDYGILKKELKNLKHLTTLDLE